MRFKKTQEKIGITKHKIHDTRHIFASLMSNANADDITIAKILGHKDFKTTSRIYIHKRLEILEKEISKIKIK